MKRIREYGSMEDQLNILLWSFISYLILALELHGSSQIMLNGGLVQTITLPRPATQLLLLNTSCNVITFTLKGTYNLIFLFFLRKPWIIFTVL